MKNKKVIFVFFAILIVKIHSWRIFHRGRSVGGNLGVPVSEHDNVIKEIPEQWFLQELDHFNPADDRKWKQVLQYFIQLYYAKISYLTTIFSDISQTMNFLIVSQSLYF